MKLIILVLSVILFSASCGGEGETTPTEADASALPVDTLRITASIGVELGDSTNTFGIISDAEYHAVTGNIIVLDAGKACLKEYTPEGSYIRQISRNGSGPGELSSASFEFFQMGSNLLVLNMMKQGFVVFDDSLNFLEEIMLWPQNPPMQNVALADSIFASYKLDFDEGDGTTFVIYRRIVNYSYGEEDYNAVFWADSSELTLSDLVSNGSSVINDFLYGLTLGGNSEIVLFALKESEDYTVHAWYPDGSDAFTITLPLEPVPKTEDEIAEEKAYMEGFLNQMGANEMGEFVPEPFRDMIVKVDIGPDNNIWVQRGTQEQPFFDIFDMEGNLIGHKVFQETGWSWQFSLSPNGILAWEDDPEEGYQQLFIVQ
jgi:hypothetical protein